MKNKILNIWSKIKKARRSIVLLFVFLIMIGFSQNIAKIHADDPADNTGDVDVNAWIKVAPPLNVEALCLEGSDMKLKWDDSLHVASNSVDAYNVYYKKSSETFYVNKKTIYLPKEDEELVSGTFQAGEEWDFLVRSVDHAGNESDVNNCESCEINNIILEKCKVDSNNKEDIPSDENDILTYSFPEEAGSAEINPINHSVEIEVVAGTDLTELIAEFTVSEGAIAYIKTSAQISEVSMNDFTKAVVYRVVSESGIGQDWIISVIPTEKLPLTKIRVWPEKRIPAMGNWDTHNTLEVRNAGETEVLLVRKFDTDEQGWSVEDVDIGPSVGEGVYDITIKGFSHLKYKERNVTVDENFIELDFTHGGVNYVLAGDTNGTDGDNFVNALDISKIVNRMYLNDERTDLNQEGMVNALDIAITIDNMYKWGDI